MIYYAHHYNWDKNARERYRNHPYFESCSDFCERWEQCCFDPSYKYEKLSFFEPFINAVFSRKAHNPEVLIAGKVFGLPTSTTENSN